MGTSAPDRAGGAGGHQRERAVNEYRQATRTKDNTQGALEEASKYTLEKYKRPPSTN